ncbi:uncharacterized protein LTR77_010238 [Saxophila tyrrhenica]|uniref:Uncharacterized protein n=1 Tax=Saxophila tyrrhenica TaxID=1690608 RepID=A0AAV9NZP6_9PEZI|nr:hypothetical protein LTR77_010238 [Saxophila tyrrhenica]
MAGTQADTNLLAAAFPDLSLGLEPSALKYQDGNVVIRLSESREILHPSTGESVTVFDYKLAYDEETFILTDEPIRVTPRRQPSKKSDLVESTMPALSIASIAAKSRKFREQSVYMHKLMFSLLFQQPFDLGLDEDGYEGREAELITVVEIRALADYYEFLPSIARSLGSLFEDFHGLWKEVRDRPSFFLRLLVKLRHENIFAEALRHVVGQMTVAGGIRYHTNFSPDVSCVILEKSALLHDHMREVEDKLRKLALFEYQSNAHKSCKFKGPKVRTTMLLTDTVPKDPSSRCHWLAKSIFRETLDHNMHGTAHWNYIVYGESGKKMKLRACGDVRAGSLRIACEAILQAHKEGKSTSLFGKKAAEKFTHIYQLPPDAPKQIAGSLRSLARRAAEIIENGLPPRPEDRHAYHHRCDCSRCEEYTEREKLMKCAESSDDTSKTEETEDESVEQDLGSVEDGEVDGEDEIDDSFFKDHAYTRMHANLNAKLDYFTYMPVTEEDMPWAKEKGWPKLEVLELKYASEEWIRAVVSTE